MSSASISTNCVSIITISAYWDKSSSISSNFSSIGVTWSSPDVTWNSNWCILKFFNNFPSRLLENSTAIHVKLSLKAESRWIWSGGTASTTNWYLSSKMWRWRRSSYQRRCCYSIILKLKVNHIQNSSIKKNSCDN